MHNLHCEIPLMALLLNVQSVILRSFSTLRPVLHKHKHSEKGHCRIYLIKWVTLH
jgi:hypothetical protein